MRFKFKKTSLFIILLVVLVLFYKNIFKANKIKLKGYYKNNKTEVKRKNLENDVINGVKIDWQDYKRLKRDSQRSGPGEQGKPVPPTSSEQGKDAYIANGFNILVSDRISLNRSLPDIRNQRCKKRKYLSNLPKTSIIIPFHNEGWSTLLRSFYSIINRTPKKLLHEIILVDDYSSMSHLKTPLEEELKKFPIIKLIRLKRREGLIRARLSGVDVASGQIIVILDSHIEVTHNWLPPLIEPILENRKTITCPMIDVIDNEDFHYETQPGDAMRGAFDWELYYKRIPIPDEMKPADPSDPFEDPVMAGGLFAADLNYFNEIGRYDPGLEIWGGEQYELSFKVWMCGGRILDTPCSRVGHIYRQFVPYTIPTRSGVNRNYKRVAEVWMDEYKEFVYKKRPFMRNLDIGNIEDQKNLRKRLRCKSFDWFMTQVAPDIIKYYPAEVPPAVAWGDLSNKATGSCIDARNGNSGGFLIMTTCNRMTDQSFVLTLMEDIRPGRDTETARSVCLDSQRKEKRVILYQCHQLHGNQLWKYNAKTGMLFHPQTGGCASDRDHHLFLTTCDDSDETQKWKWRNIDQSKLDKLNLFPNSPAD